MTYYVINNPMTGQMEYFVPDQETKQTNDHLVCLVGVKEDAENTVGQYKQAYLEQESYRFSIAKEVVEGNNTIWMNANLVEDPEEGIYQVFNHTTGKHEPVNGLTNAINRTNQLKEEFVNALVWTVSEIPSLPAKSVGSYSQQVYGKTVGSIPVEIM